MSRRRPNSRRVALSVEVLICRETVLKATRHRQLNNGGKRGRSGAGVSSPVTGSSISERAVSQAAADSDGQDGWTVVKRKRRSRKQAERQSATLAGDSRAKAEPRAPLQQTETETQSVEPSETPRQVPPTESTSPRRHPSRRQRRRMKPMEQQEAGSAQRQSVSGTRSPAMDVPAALVSETLPPRRWERADLRTESADCSPSVGPPAVPAGLAPVGPSDGQ